MARKKPKRHLRTSKTGKKYWAGKGNVPVKKKTGNEYLKRRLEEIKVVDLKKLSDKKLEQHLDTIRKQQQKVFDEIEQRSKGDITMRKVYQRQYAPVVKILTKKETMVIQERIKRVK